MAHNRLDCKKDLNHNELVRHAESLGFYQLDTSRLKKKCDVVLMRNGKVFFCEIKNPETKGKVNPEQIRFKNEIESVSCRWALLQTNEDVNKLFRETL